MASVALLCDGPAGIAGAIGQAWRPFALVTGLLLIGRVAAGDGTFASAGTLLAAMPGGLGTLMLVSLALVAAVTAVLNLDTSVVFLTPVLLQAARARGADARPFIYATAFMSNSASLLLPGSNLTNLLVFNGYAIDPAQFVETAAAPWLASVAATAIGLRLLYRKRLMQPALRQCVAIPRVGYVGVAAAVAACTLILALSDPAIPVLALGVLAAGVSMRRRHRSLREQVSHSIPYQLAVVFAITVGLGAVARSIVVPTALSSASPAASVVIGGAAAVVMNNLPAAAMLSAHPPAHPFYLLLGLNIGPNLFVTGSLSAMLWLRSARQAGAKPSVLHYAAIGAVITPIALAAAAAALRFVG